MSHSIKVSVGKFEVIDSGILNISNDGFKIEIDGLSIQFKFESDEENATRIFMKSEVTSDTSVTYTVHNMQNSLIEGFFEPVHVGSLNGRNFYLTLSGVTNSSHRGFRAVIYNLLME